MSHVTKQRIEGVDSSLICVVLTFLRSAISMLCHCKQKGLARDGSNGGSFLKYILNQISSNRANDLQGELDKLYASFKKNRKELINILENNSGIDF